MLSEILSRIDHGSSRRKAGQLMQPFHINRFSCRRAVINSVCAFFLFPANKSARLQAAGWPPCVCGDHWSWSVHTVPLIVCTPLLWKHLEEDRSLSLLSSVFCLPVSSHCVCIHFSHRHGFPEVISRPHAGFVFLRVGSGSAGRVQIVFGGSSMRLSLLNPFGLQSRGLIRNVQSLWTSAVPLLNLPVVTLCSLSLW